MAKTCLRIKAALPAKFQVREYNRCLSCGRARAFYRKFKLCRICLRDLARKGRPPWKRRAMLRLIGQTLLVQHRVSGRVAVEEKPDVLWDRPDLERLYARLEDEYELKERAGTLSRKLGTIVETARTLTDIIDADRATRLEATIVILIVAEIVITIGQIIFGLHGG